ncbi:DUF6233 domain-containing protein [Streptomyces violascens]|uniref:DUF6233 domain-containing protein n=1 Tax=Streptomyces violascens TaxID=67381 RepID=UPI00167AD54C|nr:DUF6233 domain-containing protein [Streptomyces violascens]GGU30206.1 hypothetical protein GCM10010289_59540 [Streptomyces violascens]
MGHSRAAPPHPRYRPEHHPLHSAGCRLATDHARAPATMAALDALARPGTAACTTCDAAETLLPILHHGQDHQADAWQEARE